MLLEIKDMTVHYGEAKALRKVSIGLEKGELVAIIGANGAGKTTTLNAISGLVKPTSGYIWFEGKRLDKLAAHRIVGLGISHVPEERKLFSGMTTLENLIVANYLQSDSNIGKSLERVYGYFPILGQRHRQRSSSLSGGEQQMLAIGRSLMVVPKLLLLDEPTTGLAPIVVKEIGKVLKSINQNEGAAVILVEQNVPVALSLCDRGYVLEAGSVVLEGTSRDLIGNPQVKKAYLGG